nr:PREDICTED: uncharacterized protein LOC105662086 [Megachile rotundata]
MYDSDRSKDRDHSESRDRGCDGSRDRKRDTLRNRRCGELRDRRRHSLRDNSLDSYSESLHSDRLISKSDRYTGVYALAATAAKTDNDTVGLNERLAGSNKETCEQENLATELEHIRSTLQQNGYSRHRINRTIDRLTNQTTKPTHKHTTDTHDKEHATTFLPYIQGTTDRIGRILRKHNIRTVFTTHTKIGQLLTSPKDPQPQLSTPGVYKIPCSCDQVYIGETGRSVYTRRKEHERCARLGYIQSAVAEHQITTGHKILFDKTEVLAKTSAYLPRKHREAIEIRKHPNNINRETGYHINPIWHTLFPVFFNCAHNQKGPTFSLDAINRNGQRSGT